MPSPSLFIFQEIVTKSFGSALEGLLGRGVRDEVYRILESKGISSDEVPDKFDKVIDVLLQAFGECSRVIIHRVLRVLYEKYSLTVDFSSQEILLHRLTIIRSRIVADHLRPRGLGGTRISSRTRKRGRETKTRRSTIEKLRGPGSIISKDVGSGLSRGER